MTTNRGTSDPRRPAWLSWLFPHRGADPAAAPADPLASTSPHPAEQVRIRLGSGDWEPGSDARQARRAGRSPAPGNRRQFPTGRAGAPAANQRRPYPT